MAKRKTSPRTKGLRTISAASEALKYKWAHDPVFQEKMRRRQVKIDLLRRINPERMYRHRVPDGMRRRAAKPLWEKAKEKADWLMSEFEQEGLVPVVAIPDTDEEKAKLALHETCVLALGPGEARTKLQALRTVLEFTKTKPATKIDQKISSAEAFLQEALDDLNGSKE